MFELPKATKIKKTIYKKTIYERFSKELSGGKKERFDQDISRITITNEISEYSVSVSKTEEISAIFVLRVDLKARDYQDSNIILISKLFGQKLLLVLSYEDEYRLAIYETKLIISDWYKDYDINLNLSGLNLTTIWENIVTQVGDIKIEEGNSLKEQIDIEHQKDKLRKLIVITEKKAKRELQAKKKLKLYKDVQCYKKELENL